MQISIRHQQINDAKDFYRILNNSNFKYFTARPKSIDEEIEFLRKSEKNRENHFEYTFSIISNNKIVGGGGIKINQHYQHIGRIGYFIDENYWNQGIASQFVKLIGNKAKQLHLIRLEITTDPQNIASQKVALKNGFQKEGILKSSIKIGNDYRDSVLFAKILK